MIDEPRNAFNRPKTQHKGLKILMIGLVLLLVVVVVLLSTLIKEVNALKLQMQYIQSDLNNINSSVATQTQNFMNDFSSTLDAQESLVASCEITAENLKIENGQLPITVSVIPKTDYANMTLEIQIIGKKTYVQTAVSNRGTYIAKIPVDITENNLKFMVKFNQNGVVNNEALDVYSDIMHSFLMRTDAESELSFKSIDEGLRITGRVVSIYDPLYTSNAFDSNPKCYPVKGEIIIKVNNKEVRTSSIELDSTLNEGYYSDCHIYTQIDEVIETYKDRDQVSVISRFIDNYGNQYDHEINQYPQ